MAEALYTREILRLAMSLEQDDAIAHPDGEATARSAVCGSEMTVQLNLGPDGAITQLAIKAKACAMGQASAAILQKHAIGVSAQTIDQKKHALSEFLQGAGELPGDWPELQQLAVAKAHTARHSAIILPYDAMLAAIENTVQPAG